HAMPNSKEKPIGLVRYTVFNICDFSAGRKKQKQEYKWQKRLQIIFHRVELKWIP
ncbi:MAG: hypothetical protein ACI8YP_003525, partial [Algoriphagus sp.]